MGKNLVHNKNKMIHLLPTERIFIIEFCRRHLGRTDHEIIFESYSFFKGTVAFRQYCVECNEELNETYGIKIEIPVEDWISMMELYTDGKSEN